MSKLEAAGALAPLGRAPVREEGQSGRCVSNSKSTTRAGAAAVSGSSWVRDGQAQVDACGITLRFYPLVFSPKRSASFKLLPRAVRAFSREARYLLTFAFKLSECFSRDGKEDLQE